MLYVKRHTLDIYEFIIVVFLAIFLLIRTGLEPFTVYYYYGRYLCAELLPYILLLSGLWLSQLAISEKLRRKIVAFLVIGATTLWQALALAMQYPGGEMHRLDASMRPIVDQIKKGDLLILAGGIHPSLRTSLDYYYGKNTVSVESDLIKNVVNQQMALWSNIYILSDSDTLKGFSYLGAIPIERSYYSRVVPIPMKSIFHISQYYLYRIDNKQEFLKLRDGDTINFSRNGNSSFYIGSGWSVRKIQ